MKSALVFTVAGFILLSICACNVSGNFNGKIVVNNVVLDYDNSTRIAESYQAGELEIDLGSGDVKIRGNSGSELNLMVEYKEYKPGDATILIKNGKLSYETKSGKPAAIMGVSGTVPQSVSLKIDTGSGDVEVAEMRGNRDLSIDTGSGKVKVSNCALIKLQADTGSGGVDIAESSITKLDADTGSGNVSLIGSRIGSAKVNTGSGNIRIIDSEIEHRMFETGSGKVSEEGDSARAD